MFLGHLTMRFTKTIIMVREENQGSPNLIQNYDKAMINQLKCIAENFNSNSPFSEFQRSQSQGGEHEKLIKEYRESHISMCSCGFLKECHIFVH